MKELHNFESLIDRFFAENSPSQVRTILEKYDHMKFEGPNLAEYFESLNNMLAFSYVFDNENGVPDISSIGAKWIMEDFSFLHQLITIVCEMPIIDVRSNLTTGYSFDDFCYRFAA